MHPDFEVVQIGTAKSFKAWEHGYPYPTVRWHFHPEYELHYIVATHGHCFVGDFIGEFAPGNLVLTGPNLPHNWVSDVAPHAVTPVRCRVLQFGEQFINDAFGFWPELAAFRPTLELSRRGVLFSAATSAVVGPLIAELVQASDVRRIELFFAILGALSRDAGSRAMASDAYQPDPSGFMATGINESLDYIRTHLTESFGEQELAARSRLSTSAFSRSFRRHTGMPLTAYVNRLRINLASQLLMSEDNLPIINVCFASGFTNLSNFNRQFLRQKGVSPSRFKALLAKNGRRTQDSAGRTQMSA
ncbi:MAG: AraC family transcriptional regulator [Pseudomonadota bacterium]|nr:AraC family transcriptional regulator [Pseudomonadota bacterium]